MQYTEWLGDGCKVFRAWPLSNRVKRGQGGGRGEKKLYTLVLSAIVLKLVDFLPLSIVDVEYCQWKNKQASFRRKISVKRVGNRYHHQRKSSAHVQFLRRKWMYVSSEHRSDFRAQQHIVHTYFFLNHVVHPSPITFCFPHWRPTLVSKHVSKL